MVLKLSISPETESKLRTKAAAEGIDVETFAARQLDRAAKLPQDLLDISGPVAEAFAESGMTEDELAAFLEEEKHQMREERRKRNGK